MFVLENLENSDWQLECGQIRQRGARLLASGQWADCCFLLGQRETPQQAHRLLLAMASPVFQAMFYGPLAERDAPIPLPDIQPEVFMKLLQYIYTDQIDLEDHITAIELYFAAQTYMLRRLQRLCTTYLSRNLSPMSACRIYEFAYCIGDKKLEFKSLKVIKAETKLALSDSSFEHLSLATVISIFSMDDITIDSELDLFKAAENYYLAHQEGLDEKSTASTPLSDVQQENYPKKYPSENNNSVTEDHNKESYIPHDKDHTQNEQDKESVKMLQMSDLPLVCVETENEDDRARSEATFRFSVHNLSNLAETGVMSPPFYVRELPWQIKVVPLFLMGQKCHKYLSAVLYCNNESKSSWSCGVEYQFRLVNHTYKPYSVPLVRRLFSSNTKAWGRRCVQKWDVVLDSNYGYIKDDSITVEAHMIAEEPVIPLSMKKLSEMKDVSLKTLIKQIRFLTLNPKELADYKPKSSLLTEHDIYALLMNLTSTETYTALPNFFSRCRVARKPQMHKKLRARCSSKKCSSQII